MKGNNLEVRKYRSPEAFRSPEVQKSGSPVITTADNTNYQQTYDWTSGLLDFRTSVLPSYSTSDLQYFRISLSVRCGQNLVGIIETLRVLP